MSPTPAFLPSDAPAWTGPSGALHHLDRFLGRLTRARDTHHQLRATLEMVRDATAADAACLYARESGVVSDHVEGSCFGVAFGGMAVREIFAELPAGDSHVLHGRWGDGEGRRPVRSAALVQLSRSRGVWVVVLRYNSDAPFTADDLKLISLARRLLLQHQQQQANQGQLQDLLVDLVRCLTSALDARDPYTWGHSERVARIAVRLAQQMGLPEATGSELYLGGLLHDVGKIGVPDQVLRKPGRLTDEEMELVKEHVLIGEAIVGRVEQLAHLCPLVRGHHEQYDGRGYPDGLRGAEIPPLARLLAVADACDAMMSDRPYRQALPQDRIVAAFIQGAGRQWAPDVIEAFLSCRHEVFPICQRGLGDSVLKAVCHALNAPKPAPNAPRSLLLSRLRSG